MHEMTDRDRALAEEIGEHVAQVVTARLLTAVTSDDVPDRVIVTWVGHLDKRIGRGIRRLLVYVLVALLGVAFVRPDLFAKLGQFLRGPP